MNAAQALDRMRHPPSIREVIVHAALRQAALGFHPIGRSASLTQHPDTRRLREFIRCRAGDE